MKPLFSLLSPAGLGARLSVLIFHRVLDRPDPLFPDEVDAERFEARCVWMRQWFNVLPLDQAVRRLREGSLPARAAAITFDDGYADNHDRALPILQRHGLSATFFVATAFLDGGCMWNDDVIDALRRTRRESLDLRDLPHLGERVLDMNSLEQRRLAIATVIGAIKYLPSAERLELVSRIRQRAEVSPAVGEMMSSDQVRALRRAGMLVGAHTVNHPILACLDARAAADEIGRGRVALEEMLQERVSLFAYPNGRPGKDYSPESVALARAAGFDAAVTTGWGAATHTTDPFQIPRFTPWDKHRLRFGLRLAGNLRGPNQ